MKKKNKKKKSGVIAKRKNQKRKKVSPKTVKAKTESKVKKVVKRGGKIVAFSPEKITQAVAKAFDSTGEGSLSEAGKVSDKVIQLLNKNYKEGYIPEIEEIQDLVERVLMILDYEETAKSYILYREQHRKIRDTEESLKEAVNLVDKYIGEADWKVKENANMAYSLQGLNNYISSIVSSKYWMDRVYSKEVKYAHEGGDLHIHDLQLVAAYCCGWDLQDLLRRGFTGVSGKVSCKAAKHFGSALGQMVNFIYTLQGEVAGAQAFSNFDTLLAPFVRFDKLTYEKVKQEIQSFVFNMNVSTRVGFQTPFSNITMDIAPPKNLAKEAVLLGGVPQKETYGEFQEEMNMINKAFAEVMMKGDANGRVFTFPIPTYNIGKDFDWDDKKFNPIWEMTAKYGIPYFANFVNSDMDPDDARSMCCRLRLDNRELHKRGGGLFGANPLTGSVGVVTINMPRLGYLAKNKKDFYQRLDHLMDLSKESLENKRKLVENLTDRGLYPYTKFYLEAIKMRRGQYWANHFGTIGLLGMNEAALNLIGENIASKKGQKLAEEVLTHMRNRIIGYQKQTGNLYNLEATPAEGTSYRLASMDIKKYPEMIFANDELVKKNQAEPYYTNSTHLPVSFTEDIFEALDLQDKLQTKYTGGTVLHGFLGERIWNSETTKNLVRKIAENYALPYFTLTPTFSICPVHGYIRGEHFTCPKCVIEQPTEVYSRVVGYIRPVQQWNKGKQAELNDRKEYMVEGKKNKVTIQKSSLKLSV
ncbi:MAG: ribonucleoside triphosphate reductase [Candidatus Moranbacteria bacterium CG10_big_fil_rev_8_21_14_0_10_35_21]|uniref:Ribonucleoside triphosphate reductase n=1 Tax=Candidatus Komeilibacteria bacterium CG11_big_fil_rev_8_21_14_0_20_36_20 TaxID=1974477 RepID=A0A2H0NB59_9BACT|nr:MAG: ribonucleoside triphosphate reductase [Candidatus Komeilibacteria bacterium CG11_big_fil_rev_8_21_14_0_20_36_20]PIR73868.1 MAG: ribonucleoside triphosphate reductase [Candidatus Moranbacteria bacterium CG10_big_fil_rev_8_21_14_0_10_35_21]PJA88737.1 MAG: ribonucleoside triphosphate reductase [Candidatus Moranbacteria bacterium CG_4_9_14_3_um_filter_36_9]